MQTSETIHCPYCGESVEILIDGSVEQQTYIEDCWVCCRPIQLDVTVEADGATTVVCRGENDV